MSEGIRVGARPKVLFVHGAWHGAWAWTWVMSILQDRGWSTSAIDLPGHGASDAPLTDLHGDADAVRDAIESIGGPIALVGHSYGGMVVTDAGSHENVVALVYVAAFVPDRGESLADLQRAMTLIDGRTELDACMAMSDDGRLSTLAGDCAADLLYADCTPELRLDALRRLDAQRFDTFTQAPRSIAWRTKPSAYVVCTDDRALTPRRQQHLARCTTEVLELPSSHSPFLSMPERLATAITTAIPEECR